MNDVVYLVTHPLSARIYRRRAELINRARKLPENSAKRRNLTRCISQLEAYALPKAHTWDRPAEPILDDDGRQIGTRHSVRDRFVKIRRGRPEERTIQARAALEMKIRRKDITWRELAERFGFRDGRALERAVRRLKAILRREKIALPEVSDYLEFASD